MAIAEFAGVLAGAVANASSAGATFPFPDQNAVLTELTNTAANWPVVIKKHLDTYVLPRFKAIPATPVAGVPGAPKIAWNTAAQFTKVTQSASAVTFTLPPFNAALPKSKPSAFDFKLHRLQPSPGNDIVQGLNLVSAYTASAPYTVPPSAYSSKTVAAQSINSLAAFEGFCIRFSLAIVAADRAKVSLAEVLALWRTEGDLLSPYSEQRRAAGAIPYDVISAISLGARTPEVFFSMHQGLWSSRFNAWASIFSPGRTLPTTLADIGVVSKALKMTALAEWSVIAAGVDFIWTRAVALDVFNPAGTLDQLASYYNGNHVALFGVAGDNLAARKADCKDIFDHLVLTTTFASVNERAIVAPSDPAAPTQPVPWSLVAVPLAEALIFFQLDNLAGKGPVVAPTPKLKYLAYHCQDHRDTADVEQDKFTLLLVSAAVSAAAKGPAGPLRTSLQIAGLPKPSDLGTPNFDDPTTVTGPTANHKKAYDLMKAANWWSSTTNLNLLADFAVTATTGAAGQWNGWEELRGNMARYANLMTYYSALLA